jgi:hypothetical protein
MVGDALEMTNIPVLFKKKFNQLLSSRNLRLLKHIKISYSFLRKNYFLID